MNMLEAGKSELPTALYKANVFGEKGDCLDEVCDLEVEKVEYDGVDAKAFIRRVVI